MEANRARNALLASRGGVIEIGFIGGDAGLPFRGSFFPDMGHKVLQMTRYDHRDDLGFRWQGTVFLMFHENIFWSMLKQ